MDTGATGAAARDITTLLIVALLFRLLFLSAVPRVIDSPDAVLYLEAAQTLSSGAWLGIDPKIPPLFPAMIAAVHFVVSDIEWAGRLASLLFSTFLVAPIYLVARDLFDRSTARVSGLVVSIWPWVADYGSRITTEALATLIWFLSVWLLARGLRDHPRWMPFAALSFFALHLTRPEGTFVLLAAFPAALVLCGTARSQQLKRLIPFAAVAVVLLGAYAWYIRRISGAITINYRLEYVLDEPEGSTVAADLVKTVSGLAADVPAIMLGPLLWMFAGVGLFAAGREKRDLRLELFVLFFAFVQWAVVIPNLAPAPRYIMACLIAMTIWSAQGIVQVTRLAAQTSRRQWLVPIPLGLIVLMMAAHAGLTIGLERLPDRAPRQPVEYKLAGRWMKEHLEPGLIMTRKPQIGFYAGMDSSGPALSETVESAIVRAREGGFRYLVVDERATAAMVPSLAPLLDPANAPRDLSVVNADASPFPDARVVIYEFLR